MGDFNRGGYRGSLRREAIWGGGLRVGGGRRVRRRGGKTFWRNGLDERLAMRVRKCANKWTEYAGVGVAGEWW